MIERPYTRYERAAQRRREREYDHISLPHLRPLIYAVSGFALGWVLAIVTR